MANLAGFDASTVGDQEEFLIVPEGDYPMIIIASEMKATKNGNGEFLQLVLEIIDGPYKGSRVFDRLNLNNPNPQAVDIAQRALGAICKAVGIIKPTDSAELHNKPLVAKVIIGADSRQRETNEIRRYEPLSAAGFVQQNTTPVASNKAPASAAAAPAAKAPWAK